MAEHPITPPPELVDQWESEMWHHSGPECKDYAIFMATQAARWGYEQAIKELEVFLEKGNDKH